MDGTEQRSIRRFTPPGRGPTTGGAVSSSTGSRFGLPAGSLDQVAIRRAARHGEAPDSRSSQRSVSDADGSSDER